VDAATSGRGRAPLLVVPALFCAAAALAIARTRPPTPRGADAPETAFSAERALTALARVHGKDGPHPVGSEAHERVRERLLEELRSLGLEPRVEEAAAGGQMTFGLAKNVVARIAGREEAKSLLLCAHYDSVAAGPGAGDDGSGVATLLEVARALKSQGPTRRPVEFLFSDAEECGLVGAHAYVHVFLGQDVDFVLNADSRGTGGPTYLFETSPKNADLVRAYARSVPRPCATSAAYEVYKRMPNDTDFSAFKSVSIAGLNFGFIDGLRRYHTPRDDLAHLSAASVQHEGDQVLAVARELANGDYRAKADGDVVFTDVLGFFLLFWPEGASLPAAIAILLALLGIAAADVRARRTSAGAIARGSALALAIAIAAAVAAPAVVHAIELLRGHPEPWAAHPLPFEIALVAAGVLAAGLVGRIRWFEGADPSGTWILLAIAGVALSALVPGASYLLLLPCACAAASRFLGRGALAHAIPAVALLLLWIPLAMGLELAVELRIPIALGAPVGVLIAGARSATRQFDVAIPAVVLVLSAIIGVFAPAYSEDSPAWMNLVHVEVVGENKPRLSAMTFGAPLPSTFRTLADFTSKPEPVLPRAAWLPSGYMADAERSGAAPPELEIVSTRIEPEGRVLELRITSPRGSPCLLVDLKGLPDLKVFVGKKSVVDARLGDRKVRNWGWSYSPGGTPGTEDSHHAFFGVPKDGVRLTLRAPLDHPAEITVIDVANGLPPGDARFAEARPATYVPRSVGDQWVVAKRFEL
jgi:hypothetical protein